MPTIAKNLGALFQEHNMPQEAVMWASEKHARASTWRSCPNASWLVEFAIRVGVDRKITGLATCACVRTVLPFASDPEVEECIETAEKFLRGSSTIVKLDAAMRAVLASQDRTQDPISLDWCAAQSAWNVAWSTVLGVPQANSVFSSLVPVGRTVAWSAAESINWRAESASHVFRYTMVGSQNESTARLSSEACQKKMAKIVRRFIPWPTVKEKL